MSPAQSKLSTGNPSPMFYDPVEVAEGQVFTSVTERYDRYVQRAITNPPPQIWWDEDVRGLRGPNK